jgi:hypothetical protein
MKRGLLLCLVLITGSAAAASSRLPEIKMRRGGLVLTQSCTLIIPAGAVFPDSQNQGLIQIGADNIEIDFSKDSALRGSPLNTPPDQYRGYAIRANGHRGVTVRNATISGFWCAIWANHADGLTLEGVDASDNRRARLKSTPLAEDEADWLFGHENDEHEWLTKYAAALYVENSSGIVVRDCRVWHGQNALCLDRVSSSQIYDNDFSFNSGWGVALWRCSSNVVSRNALDFCVRGYSHGVYNRGQDSAGIFAFEQNYGNVFAENSVTHGGDGFFGFAGREALGEIGQHEVQWYRRRGNSDNLLIRNDCSDAAAHGIENTFSFGNQYLANRIVGNAICGIWAGYSRGTLIASNDFENNGEMGYGLERGGVNIDHGGDNLILHNRFKDNKCGIHLRGGANSEFEKKKWGQANGYGSTGSAIQGNTFDGDAVAFQFRGPGEVRLGSNQLVRVTRELLTEPGFQVDRQGAVNSPASPAGPFTVLGSKHAVGARDNLRGRENIVMTEWGPWDHLSPLVRLVSFAGGTATYEVLKVPAQTVRVNTSGEEVRATVESVPGSADRCKILVKALQPGVHPYHVEVKSGSQTLGQFLGTLLAAKWDVTFFKWPASSDPREHLDAYRRLATGPGAVSDVLDQLDFKYGMRGPSDLGLSEKITAAKLGRDHFGMLAHSKIPLNAGTWEIATQSDDGVRVVVDGKPVIENWTWHGPTHDAGNFSLPVSKTVEITVEHFQIDGYAVLEFSLASKGGSQPGP